MAKGRRGLSQLRAIMAKLRGQQGSKVTSGQKERIARAIAPLTTPKLLPLLPNRAAKLKAAISRGLTPRDRSRFRRAGGDITENRLSPSEHKRVQGSFRANEKKYASMQPAFKGRSVGLSSSDRRQDASFTKKLKAGKKPIFQRSMKRGLRLRG